MLLGVSHEVLEREFAILEVLALATVKRSVTLLDHAGQLAVFEDFGCVLERTSHSVHTTDVGDEDILGVGRVTAQLGVEVRATVAETTVADNLHHGLSEFEVVDGELIGVPSVLGVATVGVDAAQHAVVDGNSQFMLKGMAGKCSVVDLDVTLKSSCRL